MRALAPLRRARVPAAVLAAGALLASAMPAHADGVGQAEQKARALTAQVRQIEGRVAAAERQYDAALAGVGASVNAAILAGRTSDTIAEQAQAQRDQADDRVRGLYMSGGPLAVYAALLDAQDPNALAEQEVVVQNVVSADEQVVRSSITASAAASRFAAAVTKASHERIATERSVAQAAALVTRLLAQEQALLGEANARVLRLKAAAALAAQSAAFDAITRARIAALRVLPASPAYMALYHRAATAECPGLSWTILAAIGQVESGHGRDTSTSYAGAMGPMQFMPATFLAYAVDGDHDGITDIMDPADAIYSAANYLCANGAGTGPNALANAIWHYNHADWYVAMVLALAKLYAA